ncbi:ChrR family anti-sigma-E factor [Zavarzinia compransoris]|uniref:ChrR family anti-sigma-E factor n=1 Tax=Zavarzinia compransoris TaxID=1264899 RepID=UPI0010D1878B|nr:ChrR family anti-sigma-E factor [Zavarzinia compransoris]TDP47333.1 ChrR-like anti-ECFsigma factor [Zavarzinia compransoris]
MSPERIVVIPSHHVPFDWLVERAAGTLAPAAALVVDAHLAFCPACRAALALCEQVGGALLDAVPPAPVAADAFDRLMARIEREPARSPGPDAPPPAAFGDPVLDRMPGLLHPLGAKALAGRGWRSLVPGVKVLHLDVPVVPGGSAQLIRVAGGRGVPRHTHRGNEYTLVLAGAFNDAGGRFAAGDVQVTTPSVKHKPIAEPGEICMVLAVTDAPLRLTGVLGMIQRGLGY